MAKNAQHKGRAIALLREYGWTPADVERHVRGRVTFDLFGFADVLAINPRVNCGTLALQVTSPPNVAARVGKCLREARMRTCLECGWRVEVWGVRDKPTSDGSILLARTIKLEDGNPVVLKGSLAMEE